MTHIAQRMPITLTVMPRTLTTREVAEILGKTEEGVLAAVEKMLEELGLTLEKNPDNGYALDQELTLTLACNYSAPLRMRLVRRLLAMQDAHAQFRADIQTLSTSPDRESSWSAALRLAQKQLLAATNQKALRTIRSGLENGIPDGFTPASFAAATLEFYNKNAAKLQKLDTPDAKTTLAMLKDVDLALDTPDKAYARSRLTVQTVSWSQA